MAAKTFYFKDAVPTGATLHRSLQDGGTAPTAATTGTGWIAGTNAAGQSCLQNGGSKVTRLDAQWGTTLQPVSNPSLTLGDCWRTENPIRGVFANTDWTLNFRVVSGIAAYTGRFKLAFRLWKSTDPNGASATEITSARITSAATTADLSTVTVTAIPITYTPGSTITLVGEYLFISVGIEITSAGGANTQDMQFRVSSGATVVSPEFTENFILSCASGSYTATGLDSTLVVSHSLLCDTGVYQLVSNSAVLTLEYSLLCNTGNYTYIGIDTLLSYRSNYILNCSSGSYTITGLDSILDVSHSLLCSTGNYICIGIDTILSYKSNYILNCSSGVYALSGLPILLKVRHTILCNTGNYVLIGNTALLKIEYNISCNTGSYSYNSPNITLTIEYKLLCETGVYLYSSQIAYLQVISSTALPPILYSNIPNAIKTEDIIYDAFNISTTDTLSSSTTNITTAALVIDITGATSTLSNIGYNFKRINDLLYSSDTKSITINKNINELVSISDTINTATILGKTTLDNISYSENKIFTVGKNIVSSINTSEQLVNTINKLLLDSIVITDNTNMLPNIYPIDTLLTYEVLSNEINAHDYLLKEDGSYILREDSYYIIRDTFAPIPNIDTIINSESLTIAISPSISALVITSDTIYNNVNKNYYENSVIIELLSILVNKLSIDSVLPTDTKSLEFGLNSNIDLITQAEIVSNSVHKNISDTQVVSDNITSFSSIKLLADTSTVLDTPITYSIGAENYILQEDGFYKLKEDGSYIVKETIGIVPNYDPILNSEILSYEVDKLIIDNTILTSDNLFTTISKFKTDSYLIDDSNLIFTLNKLLIDNTVVNELIALSMSVTIVSSITLNENILIDITNFLLQEDDTYYILREDDTNFIREV